MKNKKKTEEKKYYFTFKLTNYYSNKLKRTFFFLVCCTLTILHTHNIQTPKSNVINLNKRYTLIIHTRLMQNLLFVNLLKKVFVGKSFFFLS